MKVKSMTINSKIIINITYVMYIQQLKLIVTGFERTHLPRTQQEDTLFTITR